MIHRHIQQVLDGDAEAFRFIINKHKDRAYTLALSVVKDEYAAKEVVQSAFIKAYTRLDTFRAEAKFSTWLHRIVINEAFKLVNAQSRRNQAHENLSAADVATPSNGTIEKMDADHRRFYINEALQLLSPKYSLALRLFYLEEYNLKGISDVTGWSNANVKVILHRARNAMKDLLTNQFNIDKETLYR